MSITDEQRAHEIIGYLAGQYKRGWEAFMVAEQIHIAEKNKVAKISKELCLTGRKRLQGKEMKLWIRV